VRIEDGAVDQTGLDLELVVLERRDHLGGGRRVLVRPRDSRHADQGLAEDVGVPVALERLTDERVLDDPVLHAVLAELVAELGDGRHVHALEAEENGRGHLVELRLDLGNLRRFLGAVHNASSSLPATSSGSIFTPGPIVVLTVMLRR